MTASAALQTVGSSTPLRDLDWRAALPVVLLLMAQVGLYVWMAPRGFDFTDEAYYFLNYLYWRDLVGTVTFFGAYFEFPFRMLGQSVPAIRIFSLLVLFGSSAFFTREAFGYVSRRDGGTNATPWPLVLVGMTASMFYFGYLSTLRAPSYNLLALCSMLVATGSLLRLLPRSAPLANARVAMFCYGLALGACGLGKATSGVLLVLCHALFFALANRDWRLRHLLELLALCLAGVSLNFAVLQWAHPQWLAVLREGVAMVSTTDGRGLLGLANGLRWDIQALAPMLLPWAVGAVAAFCLLVRWIGPMRRAALSAMVMALVCSCVLGLMWGPVRWWLPLLGLAVLLLWSVEGLSRRSYRLTQGDAADFGLMGLLFALPIAFSFGTGMSVLGHSQMAAVFVVTAISLRLYRLARVGILSTPALLTCLAALCVPTLVIQLKAAMDVHYTYRQLSALADQTMPVHVGDADNTLLVDARTRETLQSVIDAAGAAGFAHGQPILDFTGDGPGLIYALGGRPLGTAWLLGGYPGSEATAARLVTHLTPQALKNAWLLSSEDNPRAINSWPQLLHSRIGPSTHEIAATVLVRASYRWNTDSPENITVQFWRPKANSASGTIQ